MLAGLLGSRLTLLPEGLRTTHARARGINPRAPGFMAKDAGKGSPGRFADVGEDRG